MQVPLAPSSKAIQKASGRQVHQSGGTNHPKIKVASARKARTLARKGDQLKEAVDEPVSTNGRGSVD